MKKLNFRLVVGVLFTIVVFSSVTTQLNLQTKSEENVGYLNAFKAEKAVWTCLSTNGTSYSPIQQTVLYGDTVIDGKTWKIINDDVLQQIGFVRTNGQKVIFKPSDWFENSISDDWFEDSFNTTDSLVLYDFSLGIGDIIRGRGGYPFEITDIDSVLLLDGARHKVLMGTIEGLGSAGFPPFYILQPIHTGHSIDMLICCHVNDKLLYLNPFFSDCKGNRVSDEIFSKSQWNVLYENAASQKTTHIFKMIGDTIIDDMRYNIVWFSVDEKVSNWLKLGFLRENTEEKKVYYRPAWSDRDGLLYNFNALTNDTIYTIGNSWFETQKPNGDFWKDDLIMHVIKNDDLIQLKNERYRQITLKSKPLISDSEDFIFENKWVESIGNLKGGLLGFNMWLSGTPNQELLAYFRNDELIYHSTEYEEDFIWDTANEFINSDEVKILADNGTLQVYYAGSKFDVSIFNISGMMVSRQKDNYSEAILPLSNLDKGVYIVHVSSGNKSYSQKVFIK